MSFGTAFKKRSLISEIPVYSKTNKELIGIIRLVISDNYIGGYLNRIKISFYCGAVIGLLLLLSAWGLAAFLMIRVRNAEREILEKQAQVIHAGRLTAMGEMATGIAHELNQPLAIIKIAADGLKKFFHDIAIENAMEKKAAEKITAQVERAATIITNMRSFSRTGNNQAEMGDVRIPVLKALSFFREQFRIHEIQLNETIFENEINAVIDPLRFEQVVVNLLTNARFAVEKKEQQKTSPFDKKITVNLYRKNIKNRNRIILEIKDNGSGMTAPEKERCLEPFYTTKKVGEGTGLGLSIVHTILKEQNMSLEIDSIEGKGSNFRVFIE